MRLVSRHILKGSESFASPGLSYVRWPHPVRPDDELTLEILVHESRVSASRPTLGVLRWQWLMRNQDGALVLDLEATSMFRLVAAATRE
jgi:acyl dehydratase